MKNNKGSAVIEMTFLMPIMLGIIYLYIMYLLLCISMSENMLKKTEELYKKAEDLVTVTWNKDVLKEEVLSSQIKIDIRRDTKNPVEEIRRWQLAIRTIS